MTFDNTHFNNKDSRTGNVHKNLAILKKKDFTDHRG